MISTDITGRKEKVCIIYICLMQEAASQKVESQNGCLWVGLSILGGRLTVNIKISKESNKTELKGHTNIVNHTPENQPFHTYG